MRQILSHPKVYRLLQRLAWSQKRDFHGLVRRICGDLASQHGRPARVLDIGCGDGALAALIGDACAYVGVDLSDAYIKHAKRTYGAFGDFYCADLSDPVFLERISDRRPDLILLIGVMHHCSDAQVRSLFDNFISKLPDAIFISLDGYYKEKQHPWAKFMLDWDRGDFIRTKHEWRTLLPELEHHTDNFLRYPYDFIIFYRNIRFIDVAKRFFDQK